MHPTYIHNLNQPCRNRNIKLTNNGDGSVTINGNKFETMRDCDKYLESIPRQDIKIKG